MKFLSRKILQGKKKTSGKKQNEDSEKDKEKKTKKRKNSLASSTDVDLNDDDIPMFLKQRPSKSKKKQMLANLSKDDIENYKAAFSFYDKNGNGTIDEQELILVMRTLGENPTEDQMTCIMYEMDEDGNGKIDFEEFLTSMALRRAMHDSMEDLRMAFELFDKDGDGRISAEELLDAMTTITGTMAVEEANELMKEADTDGNGFIDYKEFVAMIAMGEEEEEVE